MKISLSPREGIFLLLLIATPVAMWYFVFKPQNELTNLMATEMQDMSEKLGQYEQVREVAVENVEGDIQKLQAAMAVMKTRLPRTNELGPVFKEINGLAARNHLAVIRLNPFDREDKLTQALASQVGSQWLRVELQGDFMNLYTFLQELEVESKRIMRIHQIKIIASRGSYIEPGTVNAELQILTFYRLPPKPEKKPEQPPNNTLNLSA